MLQMPSDTKVLPPRLRATVAVVRWREGGKEGAAAVLTVGTECGRVLVRLGAPF